MPNTIPIAPKPPKSHIGSGGNPPSSGGSNHSGSSSSGGGKSGGKTKKPKDPYAAAQAKADAKERKDDKKTQERYLADARGLNYQIKALREALSGKGFRAALETRLRNVNLDIDQKMGTLTEGYADRVQSLQGASDDNAKAADSQTYAALSNKGRERVAALSEVAAQGGGESDLLQAQGAALRNWNANQSEVNRSFFDTQRSIDSSLTDLNVDTKTAMANIYDKANADREQLWSDYYDQRSETLTQLSNTYGQQSEYYGLANEAMPGKGKKKGVGIHGFGLDTEPDFSHRKNPLKAKQAWLQKQAGKAAMGATRAQSRAYEDPGIPSAVQKWEGSEITAEKLNSGNLGATQTTIPSAKPEGATLRKW